MNIDSPQNPTSSFEAIVTTDGAIKESLLLFRNRVLFSLAIVSISFLLIGGRLIELSFLSPENIKQITIPSLVKRSMSRADIIDRNGVLLSTNLRTASLYANPSKILDPQDAALTLNHVFPDLSYEYLYKTLSSSKQFAWIKRNLAPKEQGFVNSLGIPGLYFREEEKRVYPHGNLVSHVLGFVGTEGKGLSGIEKYFDYTLTSKGEKNAPLALSIDIRVQSILHEELAKNVERFQALGGAGVVMDVNTGEILAMVSLPDFDPNTPSKVDSQNTFNRATYGLYELGSTFKTFTIAGALDEGVISVNDSYDATKPLRFAGHTIRDHHAKNKWLSVPEIFMHSSNIGMARIAKDFGAESQQLFLTKLGLLEEIDIDLTEKSSPMLPGNWGTIHAMTISFGHGLAVTPLHIAAATAPIVNGGTFYMPTIKKSNGSVHGDRALKEKTSDIMRKLLRKVVEEGTGSFAAADGYVVGGKTGTAEKLLDGKYNRKARISSFVGAFPMQDPKYIVFTMLDEPKGDKATYGIATGGFTAAPVVSRVVSQIAPILGVMPVDENDPELKKALHIEIIEGRKRVAAN